jgi:Asp-tRNA(Asn)/Glu-tRNA(Gln) amidotransferase A subunit family amidase
MIAVEPWQLSAEGLAAAIRGGEVSAAEALESVLARADAVAPALNPFAIRLDDRAREAAAGADAAIRRGDAGPLAGVPVTIKDSQWLAGVPSPAGSLLRQDFVPDETCGAVQRLIDAGAVIYATTTTPEFCLTGVTESKLHGLTRNPWNLGRTPGGSSGGAAAALAAGAGPLALGGDGGGSIRIPAAFCGLVGFKPSFGGVPREPCTPAWRSLVSLGPLAHSVADARLMLRAIAGRDARDRNSIDLPELDAPVPDLADVRLVASETLGFAPVDDDVLAAFREAVAAIEAAGATIVHDDPGLPSSVQIWATIAAADAWYEEGQEDEERAELLTAAAADFLAFGRTIEAGHYVHATFARDPVNRAYADLLARHDAAALLTPTLGCEAFEHGLRHPEQIGGVEIETPWIDWAGFLYDANLVGLPALALPAGLGDDGLPVSIQLIGARTSDGPLLALGQAVESVIGTCGPPPDTILG